ncbi:MAG: DUF4845 domain-containing protein [Gammaproteobacteria bacterium]|nr:DUF4845 domain-containing protein [Gammaproteobacteria bacterium]
MIGPPARRQGGMTVIGFLLLAAVFGIVGLAALKVFPLYMEKMRVGTVLEDLQQELAGGGNTAQGIRNALEARFYVENLQVARSEVDISQGGAGYIVTIDKESRTPFFADLWFVVVINEQVEIIR